MSTTGIKRKSNYIDRAEAEKAMQSVENNIWFGGVDPLKSNKANIITTTDSGTAGQGIFQQIENPATPGKYPMESFKMHWLDMSKGPQSPTSLSPYSNFQLDLSDKLKDFLKETEAAEEKKAEEAARPDDTPENAKLKLQEFDKVLQDMPKPNTERKKYKKTKKGWIESSLQTLIKKNKDQIYDSALLKELRKYQDNYNASHIKVEQQLKQIQALKDSSSIKKDIERLRNEKNKN